jgi:hypothetical protein
VVHVLEDHRLVDDRDAGPTDGGDRPVHVGVELGGGVDLAVEPDLAVGGAQGVEDFGADWAAVEVL